jgi:hypothetical protein
LGNDFAQGERLGGQSIQQVFNILRKAQCHRKLGGA